MKIQDLFKKTYFLTVISSIMCILLGLLLFFKTTITLDIMAIMLAFTLILIGCYMIYRYLSDGMMKYFFGYSLFYAIIDIVVGIMIVVNPDCIILMISVLASITLMIEFISKIQLGILLKKVNINNWFYEILLGVLLMVVALLLIIDPISGGVALTQAMGILIIVSSLINVIDCMILKSRVGKVKKSIKELFNEK